MISEIANQYLDKPIFILGHSLGGTFGAKDEVVDHSGSEKVYENWNNSDRAKIIIENGGHGAHTIDLVLKQTIKWLENQLLSNSKKEEKL